MPRTSKQHRETKETTVDLELDLEGRQVHDRKERRVGCHARLLRLGEIRHHALDGRTYAEGGNALLERVHQQRLAVALEALGTQIEREALALEAGGVARVIEVQPRGRHIIDRTGVVALTDDALIPGPL